MSKPINSPIQKILFGSPGTGKSYRIHYEIIKDELNIVESQNIISTVFHPEYTYGDFMGKLVPITKGNNVRYQFHAGHFLRALTQAYNNIITEYNDPHKDKSFKEVSDDEKLAIREQAFNVAWNKAANVALVIDEINRGNSSAIFGTVFQLLDRDNNGWSSYKINLTEIELLKILQLMGVEEKPLADNRFEYQFPGENHWVQDYLIFQNRVDCVQINLKDKSIKIPPNLSFLGTMNTSDNSIYFMDSAFKRRWDWEFVDWDENTRLPEAAYGKAENGTLDEEEWKTFVRKLNTFIKSQHAFVRGIEDKQVGNYFIKERPVKAEQIRNKLMFFLWDSVFNRDKKPLRKILGVVEDKELVTFGDFTKMHNVFVEEIMKYEIDE